MRRKYHAMIKSVLNNKTTGLLICLCLMGFAGSVCWAGDTPDRPAKDFYNVYLKLRPVGLPTLQQEKEMAPFLSERLRKLIEEARSFQETFKHDNPGDKPPWVDGCLFASLFEGPNEFKVTKVVSNTDGTSTITVRFWYDKQVASWEDKVLVRREGGRFVLDDFMFSGAGPFNPPGRLSEILKTRDQ